MEEQDEYKKIQKLWSSSARGEIASTYENGNHCDDYGMDACLTVGNYPSDGAGSTFEQPCKETGESGTDNRFAKYSGF